MGKSEKVLWDKCFESMSEDEYCSTTLGKLNDIFKEYLIDKAAAYDRLMSGGKKTLKEWANWLGMNIAVDHDGNGCVSKNPLEFYPLGDGYKIAGHWTIRAGYSYQMFGIPAYLIAFNGDWKDSLTLPDGWEER